MGSEDLLVMALALPPVWLAATLWWSVRHAVDELSESCALAGALAQRGDGHPPDLSTLYASAPGQRPSSGRR